MARFVGKTFESLNSMLNNTGLFISNQDKTTSNKLLSCSVESKSFIRKLKNVDSKQAEEDVIKLYTEAIEKRLSEPDVPSVEVDEMIKMCMTCETMGYPTKFIYVHCLKLAQKGNLQEKHTGYSSAAFFLHPYHELVYLLINTIQKDLRSSNYIEVLYALSAICNLINAETVQNVMHLVEEKLQHERSSVRKAAILTFGHCLHLTNSQSAYQMSIPKLEKALTDRDLEVVGAAVCTMYKIIQKLSCDFSYLVKSLVELQEQILLRRVPPSMIYCDIPAPWLQLDILKILNILCNVQDQHEEVTPILKKTLQQTGLQTTLSHAIMYQVIEVVTKIKLTSELKEMVLSSVPIFFKSKNTNLKLMGVEALILISKRFKTATMASAEQEIIMDCLKLPDETLQLKTLEVLFHSANRENVEAICKKLMEFLKKSRNSDKKRELALQVLQLAIKFIDRKEWFISISTSILSEAGEALPSSDIYRIINIISKDSTLKEVMKSYSLDMNRKGESFSPSLLKLSASVLSSSSEFEELLPQLLLTADEEATTWILISLFEIILKTKEISSNFVNILKKLEVKFESSSQVLSQILQTVDVLSNIKDLDTNEAMDPTLTFLDSYVLEDLENNGSCYLPSSFRFVNSSLLEKMFEPESFASSETNFAQDSVNSSPQKVSLSYNEFSSPSTSFQSFSCDKDAGAPVMIKAKSIWTEEGRQSLSISEECFIGDNKDATDKEGENDDLKDLFAGLS